MGIKSKIKEFASAVKVKNGFSKKKLKNPVVFYGITANIAEKMDKYIAIAGEPVVFSTKDKELKNYKNKLLFDKYEVISLDDVVKLYPDADIWVSYRDPIMTSRKLLTKFAPEKIHFLK